MITLNTKIHEFISNEQVCSYLSKEKSVSRYLYIQDCSEHLYQVLLERGWRRFGKFFFVPICQNCSKCLSIRTIIPHFELTRSLKRVINKNKNTKIEVLRPTLSEEKIALYDRYHRFMSSFKGWNYNGIRDDIYFEMFVDGSQDFGYELNFYIDEKLVGVGFMDIVFSSISAVYFFYDPDYREFSLGVFSITTQLRLGKRMGLKYFYPGYWIKDHKSLGYKERYKPFEILANRPDFLEEPIWLPQEMVDLEQFYGIK